MSRNKKLLLAVALVGSLVGGTAACTSDAEVASENVSEAADNFEVMRRITVINGITDEYLLEVKGACSIEVDRDDEQLEMICKTGKDEYIKDFVGLSDNVTYVVEQGEPIKASAYHYRKTFKPQAILPDVDFRGSSEDLPKNQD